MDLQKTQSEVRKLVGHLVPEGKINLPEGAARMQRAGRAMVIVALGAFVLCACLSALYAFLPSAMHVAEVFGVVLPILFSVIWISSVAIAAGAVLWIAGWILEGFAKHDH